MMAIRFPILAEYAIGIKLGFIVILRRASHVDNFDEVKGIMIYGYCNSYEENDTVCEL